jgi:serine/threonine-protein kinase
LTGHPGVGAADTVASFGAADPTTPASAQTQTAPPNPKHRLLRPAVLLAAVAILLLLAVAGVVREGVVRHRANEPANGAAIDTNQPGTAAPAAPAVQLTRYITDLSGVLTPAGRTAVEGALAKLYTRHNVHLWVAYVNDFAGLTPLRWGEDTMRANGFTDTDGLLAIDTANRTFAFRPPVVMTRGTDGPRVSAELIRKDRIAPAVHHDEWARAAVAAANGLEIAG